MSEPGHGAAGSQAEPEREAPESVADDLARRVRAVRARVAAAAERAGRDPDDVTIVAVTKTVDIERIRVVYGLGMKVFGENRVQEARGKITGVRLPLARWEMIGHLQTNKVARAVELFARIQSVDSVKLAEALRERAEPLGRELPLLLEVNVAGEASKAGLAPEEVIPAARAVAGMAPLRLEGLMTVAPIADDPEQVRPVFRALRALLERLRAEVPAAPWRHLSMGMTDDFEVAIEEGATIVRIGRAIFGERPPA
jgi:pyridoxal phosphate enzyme (YggS family)